MEWVCEEGFCDVATRDKDWVALGSLFFGEPDAVAEYERLKQIVENFTKSKTKAELLAAALKRVLLIAPIITLDEVAQSEQLAARNYWKTLSHLEFEQTVRYSGPISGYHDRTLP